MYTEANNNINQHFVKDSANVSFKGYASVFNVRDHQGDVILPGAFKKSLVTNTDIKLLWHHDFKQPIGALQSIKEDDRGLYVEGSVFLSLQKGQEVYYLIKNNIIRHLSIGYQVLDSYKIDSTRYIKELLLWEVSAVTFPANKRAELFHIAQE